MARGGYEIGIGTDPGQVKMFIDALSDLFEPKVSRKARQTREALENIAAQKAWQWAPEMRQQYAKALQYEPGILRRAFRPSERAPEYLISEVPFESKIKTPVKGRVAPAPIDIPRPPLQLPTREDVDSAVRFLVDSGYDEKEAKAGAIQWLTGLRPGTDEAAKFEDFKQRETFKAGLRPPREPRVTEEEKTEAFKERERFRESLRRGRPEKPEKVPKEPLPPGTDVQLRTTLLRLYLTNPNVWPDKKSQEDATSAVRESGKIEDAYYMLNPDQQRTFEEVITIAEGYARKLGVTKAINQALHDLRARRPAAFQRQGIGRQPPARTEGREQSTHSQEDLEYTAKQHGISVDEVKRRLGVK